MRGMWSTLALVLVLAGLGGYIYFVDSKAPAAGAEAKAKVFAVESGQIDEVRLTTGGETTVLVKKGEGWQITEPTPGDADATEASSLVTNLASLEVNRVVEENASDLTPYGLASPRITVAFKAQGNTSGEIHLGEKTPTEGDVYAVKPGETKVFLVSSYIETTFDKKPFDLRDKRVVKFERDKVDSVRVARGTEAITLARTGSDWKVEGPSAGRADYTAVEGLLTRLSTAGMASIVEAQASDLAKYGLDEPAVSITVGAGSSQTVLDVGRADGDTRYARDRARPLVFTLDTTLTDDLSKPFDDYRKKDFFEFRPFNVQRVRITRVTADGTTAYDFEKTTSAEGDKWHVTPEGGQAKDVETAKADELMNKLSAIRAASFVASAARTGLDRPVLTIGASYDEGKFERVRIGRDGGGAYFGSREAEATIGQVEVGAVESALQALDAALAPAPTTDTEKK